MITATNPPRRPEGDIAVIAQIAATMHAHPQAALLFLALRRERGLYQDKVETTCIGSAVGADRRDLVAACHHLLSAVLASLETGPIRQRDRAAEKKLREAHAALAGMIPDKFQSVAVPVPR